MTQVGNICERPSVVARCPVATIPPVMVDGKPSLEVDEKKCICYCACFLLAHQCTVTDAVHSKLASGEVVTTQTLAANQLSSAW